MENNNADKRFCGKCGAELGEGVKFCSNCGAAAGEQQTVETAQTPAYTPIPIQVAGQAAPVPAVSGKKSGKTAVLITALSLITVFAVTLAVLFGTGILRTGKTSDVPVAEQTQPVSVSDESEAESETQTTVQPTAEPTTVSQTSEEKITFESAQIFLGGITLNEIKQKYSSYNELGIGGGVVAIEPVFSDGTKSDYCAVFEGYSLINPSEGKSLAIYVYKKGVRFFGNSKIGDSVEEFKLANSPDNIEIFYNEEESCYYCTAEFGGASSYRVTMWVSDSQGSEICDAYITKI